MSYKNAPVETRFPVNRKDHTKKHPNGYLVPLLKRLLKKNIEYQDPGTRKMIKGKVKDAVIWRLILNATEGETPAIKEIIDRIDGKIKEKVEHSGEVKTGGNRIIIIRPNEKAEKEDSKKNLQDMPTRV